MALSVPLMSTERISSELGWAPRHVAGDTLLELMAGVRRREAIPTAVLAGDRATSTIRF
jgi:hypothetical protein